MLKPLSTACPCAALADAVADGQRTLQCRHQFMMSVVGLARNLAPRHPHATTGSLGYGQAPLLGSILSVGAPRHSAYPRGDDATVLQIERSHSSMRITSSLLILPQFMPRIWGGALGVLQHAVSTRSRSQWTAWNTLRLNSILQHASVST